jgi:hypothetical protein
MRVPRPSTFVSVTTRGAAALAAGAVLCTVAAAVGAVSGPVAAAGSLSYAEAHPCSLLTTSEIAADVGKPPVSHQLNDTSIPPGKQLGCTWSFRANATSNLALPGLTAEIVVRAPNGEPGAKFVDQTIHLSSSAGKVTHLPGTGTLAYVNGIAEAAKGSVGISVSWTAEPGLTNAQNEMLLTNALANA